MVRERGLVATPKEKQKVTSGRTLCARKKSRQIIAHTEGRRYTKARTGTVASNGSSKKSALKSMQPLGMEQYNFYFNHEDNQSMQNTIQCPAKRSVKTKPKLCVCVEEDPGTGSRATHNSHGQPGSSAGPRQGGRFIAHQTKTHIGTNGRKYCKQTIRLKDKLSYTANPWNWR